MLVKRRDSESDCRGRFREDKVDMAKTGLFEPQMLGPDAWRHIRKVYRIIVCRMVVGMIDYALSQSPASFPTPDKGDEASEMGPKSISVCISLTTDCLNPTPFRRRAWQRSPHSSQGRESRHNGEGGYIWVSRAEGRYADADSREDARDPWKHIETTS